MQLYASNPFSRQPLRPADLTDQQQKRADLVNRAVAGLAAAQEKQESLKRRAIGLDLRAAVLLDEIQHLKTKTNLGQPARYFSGFAKPARLLPLRE